MRRIINHLGYNFIIEDSHHVGNPDTPKGSVVLWGFSAWFKVNNGQWLSLKNRNTQEFANTITTFQDAESLKKFLQQFGYNS
jgi:hypothetical protein